MSSLEKAINIATKAHAGQIDKAGKPYILHPLRVMFRVQTEVEMIVAVMHDVIEDSNFELGDLEKLGFSNEVMEAINCLTKRRGECYENFILRILENDLAARIKIEDIKDNLDLTRLHIVTHKDLQRVEKYHRALRVLTNP